MTTKTTTNKQTIWLSTMMVLSLMLIGYYTVGTPGSNSSKDTASQTAQTGKDGKTSAKTTATGPSAATASKKTGQSDYFLQLETSATQKMTDELSKLTAIVTNQNAKPDEQQQAQAKINTLQSLINKQANIEDQIVAMGYKDAVVTGDADKVDVMVQADNLDAGKALAIINLVQQQIPSVSVHNITVGSHK